MEEGRRAVELLPWLACPEKGTCLRAQLSTAHGNSTPSTIITPTHTRTQWFDTQLKKEEGQLVTVAEEHQDGLSVALMRGVKFIITLILFVKWNTSQRVTNITKPSIKISLAHPWDCERSTSSSLERGRGGDHVAFAFSPMFFRLLQRVSGGPEDER